MIFSIESLLYRILWLIIFLGWGITTYFWSRAMQDALRSTDPAFRRIRPEYVWLSYIPVWNLAWQFIIVNAVAKALREEFIRRSYIVREPNPGRSSGYSASILFCFVVVPPAGILITIASFIPRIIHTIRIRNYTEQLRQIIAVQNAYAANPLPADPVAADMPEPQLNGNDNPERFMPKQNEEEDLDRWRKKD